MPLPRRYVPNVEEPKVQALWEVNGVFKFDPNSDRPVYSIDTPPPTVSGNLHLGHTYSYTHTDIFARFHRMLGDNVFYPMGFDDNGLPTERLVEKTSGNRASELDLEIFKARCQQISKEVEKEYQQLYQRLGLSVDWNYTYRTIDNCSQVTSQKSFLDLYKAGLVYREKAPTIWCTECGTAIAQADVDDLQREGELVTLAFILESGAKLPIATTRPKLLPACVAIFVHPEDDRLSDLVGEQVQVPLYNRSVTVQMDRAVNRETGTGAVMCCTFGDTVDKHWWFTHQLEYIEAIDHKGRMTEASSPYEGLRVAEARQLIKQQLKEKGFILEQEPTSQVIPIHERCDTPIEILMSQQWFIRLMDIKEELLAAADQIAWYPGHMKNRYQSWVENLAWDWCISRQRYYGIHIPLWYCESCGEVILAEESQLPVDPNIDQPSGPCTCGSKEFTAEQDLLETWATSSMTPQIAGRWLCKDQEANQDLFSKVYPFSLRPQAHEIIRTWAFYTIAKSHFHHHQQPWEDIAISGWGIAGEGMGKISKSRGGGPMPPLEMMEKHSADGVRYWAASTGLGKDAIISEEKIILGSKLSTKIWNVARFCEKFIADFQPPLKENRKLDFEYNLSLTPADRWILSSLQKLVGQSTRLLKNYDYAPAKSLIENFFWADFADNYLEMSKQRLYAGKTDGRQAARYTLYYVLLTVCKLFAPYLPYITESIYQQLFAGGLQSGEEAFNSIHLTPWPEVIPALQDESAIEIGRVLLEIAVSVRRYKSENNLSLSTELPLLQIATTDPDLATRLGEAKQDLGSITRASKIQISQELSPGLRPLANETNIQLALKTP